MPTIDYIQPFFNIKGEFITNSYRKDNSLIYEVILPVTEHICPYCGYTTKYIKDYRVRTINLGSIHGLYICAKYKQRRYSCPQCTHSFSEENPFIQRYKQLGMTTISEIFRLLHEGLNYTTIARACHVSVTTVIRYYSLISISRPKELPTVLGINEFRGNAVGKKYRVILTDPDSHNVIDMLPKKDTIYKDCFLGMQVVSTKLLNELILLVLSIAMTSKICNPKLNIYQKKYGRYTPYYLIKLPTKEMKYKWQLQKFIL